MHACIIPVCLCLSLSVFSEVPFSLGWLGSSKPELCSSKTKKTMRCQQLKGLSPLLHAGTRALQLAACPPWGAGGQGGGTLGVPAGAAGRARGSVGAGSRLVRRGRLSPAPLALPSLLSALFASLVGAT